MTYTLLSFDDITSSWHDFAVGGVESSYGFGVSFAKGIHEFDVGCLDFCLQSCNPSTYTLFIQGRWRWASPHMIETDSILPQCMQFYNYIARSSLLHEFSLLTSHFSFHAQGINISIRQREHWWTVFVFSRPLPVTLFAYVGGANAMHAECAHYVDDLLPHAATF